LKYIHFYALQSYKAGTMLGQVLSILRRVVS